MSKSDGWRFGNTTPCRQHPRANLTSSTAVFNRTLRFNGNYEDQKAMPTFIRPALIKAGTHIYVLQQRAIASTARAMAPKQEWMAIVPDYPGALAKRMEVRPYVWLLNDREYSIRGPLTASLHTGNISKGSSRT